MRRLIRILRAISDSLHDGSRNAQRGRGGEHEPEQQDQRAPARAILELHIPQATIDKYEADSAAEQRLQSRARKTDQRRFVVECVTLAVLVIGTVGAFLNLHFLNEGLKASRTAATAATAAAETAQDSLVIENRPWLYFERRGFRILTGADVRQIFVIQANGITPALNIAGCVSMEVLPLSTAPHFDQRPCQQIEITRLKPGTEEVTLIRAYVPNSKPPQVLALTRDEALAFAGGKTYVTNHGRFTYRDVFGIEHWATLCDAQLTPDMTTSGPNPALIACSQHNEIDSNTRKKN